jgi:hypothetical protein
MRRRLIRRRPIFSSRWKLRLPTTNFLSLIFPGRQARFFCLFPPSGGNKQSRRSPPGRSWIPEASSTVRAPLWCGRFRFALWATPGQARPHFFDISGIVQARRLHHKACSMDREHRRSDKMRAGYIPPLQQPYPLGIGRGGIYAALVQYQGNPPKGPTER